MKFYATKDVGKGGAFVEVSKGKYPCDCALLLQVSVAHRFDSLLCARSCKRCKQCKTPQPCLVVVFGVIEFGVRFNADGDCNLSS